MTPRLDTDTAPVGPDDTSPPSADMALAVATVACTVQVDALLVDACSGPLNTVDVIRDGLDVATGVTLPHDDTVPANGAYVYELPASDQALDLLLIFDFARDATRQCSIHLLEP